MNVDLQNIKDIIDLFKELGISFELGEDVFSNDEMKVLSLANKKVKKSGKVLDFYCYLVLNVLEYRRSLRNEKKS